MTIKPLPADVATIRAAIADVQDSRSWFFCTAAEIEERQWLDDSETEHRTAFIDAVIARIAQLQQPPFVEQVQKEK